ncbi:MAG: UDP-N-acetylmuramate dehydrogenase [Clostridia bacterium]|nr:UDP-N-acetylmuramate dehydrogenase [Clostridia bacterium]
MLLDKFLSTLDANSIIYLKNAPLLNLNSFRLDSYAKVLVYPETKEELCYVIEQIIRYNLKYFVLGNGTNVVFLDKNYDGIIVSTRNLNRIKVLGETIEAECGALATKLSSVALESSLAGLEFCYGLPGSVGGAVYMNASAYGSQISDIVFKTQYFNLSKNKVYEIYQNEHKFSAKKSIFQDNKGLILSSTFKLKKGQYIDINNKMNELITKRKSTQPLNLPSAGSVFKRPLSNYASKLIDEAGLKGKRVGDAQVSIKHAGFIVNLGRATGKDILRLTQIIKAEVKLKFNIELEEEIIFVK